MPRNADKPTADRPATFAGELSKKTGWRQVTLAAKSPDYDALVKAKKCFGATVLARSFARFARELLRLCHAADRK